MGVDLSGSSAAGKQVEKRDRVRAAKDRSEEKTFTGGWCGEVEDSGCGESWNRKN